MERQRWRLWQETAQRFYDESNICQEENDLMIFLFHFFHNTNVFPTINMVKRF